MKSAGGHERHRIQLPASSDDDDPASFEMSRRCSQGTFTKWSRLSWALVTKTIDDDDDFQPLEEVERVTNEAFKDERSRWRLIQDEVRVMTTVSSCSRNSVQTQLWCSARENLMSATFRGENMDFVNFVTMINDTTTGGRSSLEDSMKTWEPWRRDSDELNARWTRGRKIRQDDLDDQGPLPDSTADYRSEQLNARDIKEVPSPKRIREKVQLPRGADDSYVCIRANASNYFMPQKTLWKVQTAGCGTGLRGR